MGLEPITHPVFSGTYRQPETSLKLQLSYGGGVNSTALLLLMIEAGVDFEAVFINHGGDWPETYEYVEYINQKVYPITTLFPDVQGFHTIYDYFWNYEMVPYRRFRACTDKFKIRPLRKHAAGRLEVIGIGADEAHRVKGAGRAIHPLVCLGFTRDDCKSLIKRHGLVIPPRSGCFFCPMQRKGRYKVLKLRHPDLFQQAMALEERNMAYRKRKGLRPYSMVKEFFLRELWDQHDLWPREKPKKFCP